MFDFLFEKRFVYQNREKLPTKVSSSNAPKKCVPHDANWFVRKYQTWFKNAKICNKPKPKAGGVGNVAKDLVGKQLAYRKEHGKDMSRLRSGYEFLKSMNKK